MTKSYTVYKESGTYKAKNDQTGTVEKTSINGIIVTQYAIDNLTPNRVTQETVFVDLGSKEPPVPMYSSETLHIRSKTRFILNGTIRLNSGLIKPHTLIDTPDGKDIIIGTNGNAVIDGNVGAYNQYWNNRLDSPSSHGIVVGDDKYASKRDVENITVAGVTVKNTIRSNILVQANELAESSNNINIKYSIFENALCDHNVYLSSGKGITIDNCRIRGYTAEEAISLATSSGTYMLKDAYIQNCIFENIIPNTNGYPMSYAIGEREDKCDNIVIQDNTISLGTSAVFDNAIRIRSRNSKVLNNIILGNFRDITRFAIAVLRGDTTLSGNQVSNTNSRGILITNAGVGMSNIDIKNNNIRVYDQAIRISADGATLSNIRVDDCELIAYGPKGYWVKEEQKNGGILKNIVYRNNNVKGNKSIIVGVEIGDNTIP